MPKLVALVVVFVALFACSWRSPKPARSALVAFFSSLEMDTGMNLKFKTSPSLT